MLKMAMQPRYW